MAKHLNSKEPCPSCDEKLKSAHPDLQSWFKTIKHKFPEAHISWAWRNKFDQNQFVAEGKSRAPWPRSKHNSLDADGKPCSDAIDLFEIASNGMACWRWVWFKEVAAFSKAQGLEIIWGGDWERFKDSPHFERKTATILAGD